MKMCKIHSGECDAGHNHAATCAIRMIVDDFTFSAIVVAAVLCHCVPFWVLETRMDAGGICGHKLVKAHAVTRAFVGVTKRRDGRLADTSRN